MGRIRGKANKADILAEVCYRPPHKDEKTDEAFFEQLAEITHLLALVLTEDFNMPDMCWR